ncbi:MAG: aminopeptidase P family protein [Clostridium sp.]
MNNTVNERIAALRVLMSERDMDAYLVPTSDFHQSEYVDGYFKCRKYITGFTGSAGTAVITMKEAGLWVDGRYFVQAPQQVKGSEIKVFRMGDEGVPSVEEYMAKVLPMGGVLGFDGRVISEQFGEELEGKLGEKEVLFSFGEDLIGEIWNNRPSLPKEPIWILEEKYAGKPASEKIADLRKVMKEKNADVHILTGLDDIIWLLNIRGNDIPCTPVVLSYAVITPNDFYLFINPEVLDKQVNNYLKENGVTVLPYDEIYRVVKTFKSEHVMLEKGCVNYTLCGSLDDGVTIIDTMNPTSIAKAVKNPVEIENIKKAHIKDGVAMAKYLFWLKQNVGKTEIDEMAASDYLDRLRTETEGNLGLSFATISAYSDNAAMCHYSATTETSKKLQPRGLYLVDSGGQYYEGTTDVTRTIALGEITEEERRCFTLVACCMLRLKEARFPYGCHGYNFDYAARELLWREGLDFNHGTGHGVGYLGGVHERPNGVRWRIVPERQDNAVFEAGMITSDEPGLYIEGKFGIRTENMLLCVKGPKNEFGQFMQFENLTWVPIDLDALDRSIMEERDIELLNNYHLEVREKISPYLTAEEAEWLKTATRAI